jgi:hypothetical protein
METHYALKCIERLILDGKNSIDVKIEPYQQYNEMLDERNRRMAWSDPRAQNDDWTKFGRSATQNPLTRWRCGVYSGNPTSNISTYCDVGRDEWVLATLEESFIRAIVPMPSAAGPPRIRTIH